MVLAKTNNGGLSDSKKTPEIAIELAKKSGQEVADLISIIPAVTRESVETTLRFSHGIENALGNYSNSKYHIDIVNNDKNYVVMAIGIGEETYNVEINERISCIGNNNGVVLNIYNNDKILTEDYYNKAINQIIIAETKDEKFEVFYDLLKKGFFDDQIDASLENKN